MIRTVFIFGYGYTATYLSRALQARGVSVSGSNRTGKCNNDSHMHLFPFDLSKPLDPSVFKEADAILVSIPPLEEGGDLVLRYYGEYFKKLTRLQWLGYLSATSVYGDHQGALLSELSNTHPSFASGQKRLGVEGAWRSCAEEANLPLHIFRLSGIYGPARSILDRVDEPSFQNLYAPKHFFSRIHVLDIVQTLLNSMDAPEAGAIYNVTDDEAAPFHEVVEYAASLKGIMCPPRIALEQADISTRMREFFSDHRLISNEKIKTKLAVNLIYPTYREGLMAIHQDLPSLNH